MEFVGIQKVSLVDYDGLVATTLFTNGCNFKCEFCHNKNLVNNILENNSIDFDDLINYLKSRKNMIQAVVISGGEPTLHKDLIDKIKVFKSLGYLVKLDTNGTNPSMLKELIENKLIDYVAMDIKNDFDNYENIINTNDVNINKIKESISILLEDKVDYEFRTTLIKEFHSKENMLKIRELIKGAKKYFLQKYKQNENCINPNLHEISELEATKFKEIFKDYINLVELRGYENK